MTLRGTQQDVGGAELDEPPEDQGPGPQTLAPSALGGGVKLPLRVHPGERQRPQSVVSNTGLKN